MNQITYILTENRCCNEMNVKTFYGIQISDGSNRIIATVRDITTDGNRLSELIRTCNLLALSPLHLYDVIEDFLAE